MAHCSDIQKLEYIGYDNEWDKCNRIANAISRGYKCANIFPSKLGHVYMLTVPKANSMRTSRERHKSALYLRLKNSKMTSEGQVSFYSTRKTKKLDQIGTPWPASACPWRTKRGTLWDFSTSILSQNIKKLKGHPLVIFFESLTIPKKTDRGTLRSPSVLYGALKRRKKPFWFSSLGQMVRFDTIKFCRTLWNYFGQFVWIEKIQYYSRVCFTLCSADKNGL